MKSLLLALFLLLLLFTFYLLPQSINAQVPGFKVPCDQEKDPEFDSLRPYQASPCGDSPKAKFCNNDYIIEEGVKTKWDGSCTQSEPYICPTDQHLVKNYLVDGEGAKLPILGNTEDVKNSQSASDALDDATKMNEYVSWYLNGVINRAEYGNAKNTDDELVNLSGPLQKLLPSSILEAQRIISVENASKEISFADTESASENDTPEEATDVLNHNQIVVCASRQILGLIGKMVPHECYAGNDSPGKGKTYRLKDWEGHLPPLPWDKEFAGDTDKYLKARCKWKGGTSITIPFINKQVCIDNPLESNEWADLFSYVPLANTVDKNAKQLGEGVRVKGQGQTLAERGSYSFEKEPVLFYPHSQEVYDLTTVLNSIHVPKKEDPTGSKTQNTSSSAVDYETGACKIIDVRSNSGDQLFPSSKSGRSDDLTVSDIQIHVTQIECDSGPINDYLNNCLNNPTPEERKKCKGKPDCKGSLEVIVRTVPKIPFSDEIWKNTVVGQESVFRQIYPKVEAGAPVSCIADIPGVTPITYNPDSKTNLIGVEGPNGRQSPEEAKLYFPHLGTVYDYFLKGIQTALRPQGYGEQPISGQYCNNIKCGELPKGLPKASGSCNLGSSGIRIPQSLKDIVNAAAQTYKTPPNLILGIMFGEGLFEDGRFNWTDQNVKNWATCQKIPNCKESGDDNFMGFNGDDWVTVSKGIGDDLKKLDPTRKEPSPCNLLDAVYGVAWNLHNEADGGGGQPPTCFNIPLKANIPTSCSWNDSQYASAIKASENGYDQGCFTREGSCLTGGGNDALCDKGVDACETKDNRFDNPSHFACVWDVGHGQ